MNVFNIGTLNVLSSKAKKLSLKKDIDHFSLDVYYIKDKFQLKFEIQKLKFRVKINDII